MPAAGRARAHRLHRGRHPQPAALAAPSRDSSPTRSSTAASSGTRSPTSPPRVLHDVNVIGTLQLLAACQRTESLERRGGPRLGGDLRLRGASPASSPRRWRGRFRFAPASSAISPSSRATSRTSPAATRELVCCMLRFQPEIGPELDMPLVRYLSLPVVPTQLGFDPRLQLLHADDATGALEAATRNPVRGAVNVAPVGIDLAEPRSCGSPGRPSLPIPHPLFGPALERSGRQLGAGPASTATACGCFASAAAWTTGACAPRSAMSPASTPRAPFATSSPRVAGRRLVPSLHPGDVWPERRRRAPIGRVRGAADAPEAAAGARRLPAPDARRDRGRPRPDEAAERAADALPKALPRLGRAHGERLAGEYHEDEWGFDEEFAEAVYPLFEFLYDSWWRVQTTGAVTCRPTVAACSSPTTRARSSPSTPR